MVVISSGRVISHSGKVQEWLDVISNSILILTADCARDCGNDRFPWHHPEIPTRI